ncbi:hypothetical protein [Histidinibacterium lentulum]|uniref:Uncharacterized protein n=1 Tax=Histidinibacterium lentulum TaxID=2480588 RepID=A0A3N2R9D1_9RHOB|nr:hypothetical protein [Histidinibacterium lentulum]ROU03946.1 hypothetical protein EAT49_00655 [Histidinibacterium lentulum]
MSCKPLVLAVALGLALPAAARAGDTVTDNLPGGAVQQPGAGAVAAQLNAAPLPTMIAPGGQPPPTGSGTAAPTSPGATPLPGPFAMRSTRGRSFATASPFIGRVLNSYARP